MKDLKDQRFVRLTALSPTDMRRQGSIIWHCQCDCGNTVDVSSKELLGGYTKSCGCLRVDTGSYNGSHPTDAVTGTRVSALNHTIPTNNVSGIKGVSWSKQKQNWEAYIKFRGRQHHLGHYKNIEDAAKARARAEEQTHGKFLEWYEEYKKNKVEPKLER